IGDASWPGTSGLDTLRCDDCHCWSTPVYEIGACSAVPSREGVPRHVCATESPGSGASQRTRRQRWQHIDCTAEAGLYASLVETRPSDLISGSDSSPVLHGRATPTGQRKLSGRWAGKGLIFTASSWFPPRHMRLPCLSRPTTMTMCPPPVRFIGAKAPTAGAASFWPQLFQSSAHRVSVPLIPTLVSTILAYSAHQGISSCL